MSSDSSESGPKPDEPDASDRVALNVDELDDSLPELAAAAEEPKAEPPAASKPEVPPSSSGSVEVAFSNASIPRAVTPSESQPNLESQPVSESGGVVAVAAATEGTGPARRTRRVTGAVQGALSGGVERLGAGIGIVGEGVTRVGDLTKKVPLVGAGVGALGEGLTKAGESIHALPQVAKTRRGRLLVRSVIVGFLLVFSWIAVIVGFQLRAHDTPDFRPEAERILVELNKGPGSIAQVYEHASPRFHEIVKKEVFINDMMDLNATNGKFGEITAINETLVTKGPTGRVGRVGLTAAYERGVSKGSISFHWHEGTWKLLGIGIELPENVQITQLERQNRIAACLDDKGRDVSDQRRKCDVRDAAETILELVRDGRSGEVWDAANPIFKQQQTRASFIEIQEEQRRALGAYRRVLTITDARSIGGLTSTFDIVAEFEKASGVRVEFDFTRPSKFERWQLARFKVTLPMPRANEAQPETSETTPAGDAAPPVGG